MTLDYSVIGNRIKNKRKEKGYTQEDLAKKLKITVAYISRVERGSTKVNLKRLVELSNLFEEPLGYFLTGCVTTSDDYLVEDFKKILDECTVEQQRAIFRIAKIIAKLK